VCVVCATKPPSVITINSFDHLEQVVRTKATLTEGRSYAVPESSLSNMDMRNLISCTLIGQTKALDKGSHALKVFLEKAAPRQEQEFAR